MTAADDFVFDLASLHAAFCEMVPHARALGFELTDISAHPASAIVRLPWHPRLVGNPQTRMTHGGAITTLLDSCCGISVFAKLQAPTPIATLDLRIDSLKPALPDRDLFARAECYRATRNIAFVRAVAYQDERDPVASAAATFMLSTKGSFQGYSP